MDTTDKQRLNFTGPDDDDDDTLPLAENKRKKRSLSTEDFVFASLYSPDVAEVEDTGVYTCTAISDAAPDFDGNQRMPRQLIPDIGGLLLQRFTTISINVTVKGTK